MRLRFAMDEPTSCAFDAPFEPDNRAFRDAFRPFTYLPTDVAIDGEKVLTGTMMTPTPVRTPDDRVVSVSAYSKEAVLADCSPSIDNYPIEFNGQRLREISDTIGAPFGISSQFDADPGPVFERVSIEPAQKGLQFLSKLARQRGLITGSTPEGKLRYSQETDATPVAVLSVGQAPLMELVPQFNSQNYFSELTALGPAFVGQSGSFFKANNTKTDVFRPLTYRESDADLGDLPVLARARLGRMFANTVSYTLTVPTWRDSNDSLWQPNTRIKISAPDAMIYNPTVLLVRWVELTKTAGVLSATLGLVLPGVFSGKVPEVLPWEE